jgi:hypothetical protein
VVLAHEELTEPERAAWDAIGPVSQWSCPSTPQPLRILLAGLVGPQGDDLGCIKGPKQPRDLPDPGSIDHQDLARRPRRVIGSRMTRASPSRRCRGSRPGHPDGCGPPGGSPARQGACRQGSDWHRPSHTSGRAMEPATRSDGQGACAPAASTCDPERLRPFGRPRTSDTEVTTLASATFATARAPCVTSRRSPTHPASWHPPNQERIAHPKWPLHLILLGAVAVNQGLEGPWRVRAKPTSKVTPATKA